MRRLSTALSLLLALSICLAAIAPVALAEEATSAGGDRPPDFGRTVITWTPASKTVAVAPGETQHVQASFVSTVNIPRVAFVVSFPLSRVVRVTTPTPFAAIAGQSYTVDLAVSLPQVASSDQDQISINGTIHVLGQFGPLYQAPLLLTVMPVAALPPVKWSPEKVSLSTDAAGVLPSAIDVEFTTSVAISNARLRATPPLDRVLHLSMTGPVNLVPGVVYRLTLTAHLPIGITAVEDLLTNDTDAGEADTGPIRSLVSGMVQIYTPLRVYQRMLPVTVVVVPQTVLPTVRWQPPLVNVRLPLGSSASYLVTATTNVPVAHPTLQVEGDIAPFVTAAFVEAAPDNLLPLTPYHVALDVSAPVMALVNRPLAGSVAIVDGDGHVLRYLLKVTIMWQRPAVAPTPTTTS